VIHPVFIDTPDAYVAPMFL